MGMLDDVFRLTRLHLANPGAVQPLHWQPAVDIYRTQEGWLVKVELAGVRREEIEVHAQGRRLIIRGRRCDTACVEAAEHYSLEIAYSQFERSIELPCDLEQTQVVSQYQDGMLFVRVSTGSR